MDEVRREFGKTVEWVKGEQLFPHPDRSQLSTFSLFKCCLLIQPNSELQALDGPP
ncbi:hypothetical protein L873DRAFT_1821571, partial [Choiromyces venosus 120613-1]